MGNDIRDLETDLLYLRKGAGCTPGRMAAVGTLRLVLGGDDLPYADMHQRLESAIGSLHDDDAALLLDVFALSPDTEKLPTLRARRLHHGAKIGRKIDTVAGRETKAIANLRNQLLTGWYPTSPMPPGARVPEMHNSVIQENVEILTIVEDGYWQQTREHYRFLALFDEADYLRISNSFPGTVTPQPPFTVRSHKLGESYSHDFYHQDGPMRRGQTYDLYYTIRPDPDLAEDRRIQETSRAFHERTLTATFEVIFIGEKPETIWSFKGLTYFERPGQPGNGQTMPPKGGGAIRQRYRDIHGGLFAGLSCSWE